MYQIKLNPYLEIITDNINLNMKYYYQFIDDADDITYLENQGFIIKYNNDSYFFRLNNYENNMIKHKNYELLPYTHQRLVRNYHIKHDIIESESDKSEYLEKLRYNKPKFLNIFKTNIMSRKFFSIKDFPLLLLIESIMIVLGLINTIEYNISFDYKLLYSLFIDNFYLYVSPVFLVILKDIGIKIIQSYKQYKNDKNEWLKKIKRIEKIDTNKLGLNSDNYIYSPVVNKMKELSNKIQLINIDKKKQLIKEFEKIVLEYDKRKVVKDKDQIEQDTYYKLELLELKIKLYNRESEVNKIVDIKTIDKTFKKK